MKLLLVIVFFAISLFGKDFYFKDGRKLKIEETFYGILVDDKYRMIYTGSEYASNSDRDDIYQNMSYKYVIYNYFSDVVIINKTTGEIKNLSDIEPSTHRIIMFKNGKFFDYHTSFPNLQDCKKSVDDYNSREDLKKRGFLYKCESIK